MGELTKKLKAETTTFCNIQDNAPSFCTCGTEEPLPKRDSGAQSDSKEKNRQALLRYLQNKDVRKALAQSLQQQGRMDLLRQKYLATEQWVTAQQQTTVTSIPPQNITEKISLTGFSPEEDFLSSTSSKKTYSIVDELVQRCRDGKRSPLPAVETLTRSTQFGTCVLSKMLSTIWSDRIKIALENVADTTRPTRLSMYKHSSQRTKKKKNATVCALQVRT